MLITLSAVSVIYLGLVPIASALLGTVVVIAVYLVVLLIVISNGTEIQIATTDVLSISYLA